MIIRSNIIKHVAMADYTYDLPAARIAHHPLSQRDASALLVLRPEGRIEDSVFTNLDDHLPFNAMMVINDTRVVQARLIFHKESGARVEVFCIKPISPVTDVQQALSVGSPSRWHCLVGNAKKWKSGSLVLQGDGFWLKATLKGPVEDGYEVEFDWNPNDMHFAGILDLMGKTPLPPYIPRPASEEDKLCYQTTYAKDPGSVAAPTAGLHFSPHVFEKLKARGIGVDRVTLHVGAGTFKPVTSATIGDHRMHSEQYSVPFSLVNNLMNHQGPVVSVGTTSMRTLESLYWVGVRLLEGDHPGKEWVDMDQWFPYQERKTLPSRKEALKALCLWMEKNKMEHLKGSTALLIAPGCHIGMTDILITNFHQPGSTLLLLVAAFAGDAWKGIYDHALAGNYRFLSYGDACLLFKQSVVS